MAETNGANNKILLFTASFPPPAAGGSVEYLYNIFSHFQPGTVVINTGNSGKEMSDVIDQKLQQHVIRSSHIIHVVNGHRATKLHRLAQNILWPLNACRLIAKEKPDLVAIGEFSIVSIAALAFRIFFKLPYVLFTYAEEITYIDTRPLYKKLLNSVLKNAIAVFAVSEYTRQLLIERGTAPQIIHKVLPSVGENKCLVASKEDIERTLIKYGLVGKKVLLTVGRIVERKGHETVIQVLPDLLKQNPNIKYVIVGIGPYENILRRKITNRGLHEQVALAGCADDSELSALYDLCDVFVMPHRELPNTNDTEGCPTVFLEASAHGKPCIGGNAGGVADAILHGKTGLIIDGTNPAELSGAIMYLLNYPEVAKQMGESGREYVSTLTPEANSKAVQIYLSSVITPISKSLI